MENRTFILQYSKLLNHPAQYDTSQYQSRSHNLVSETGKHEKSLKKIIEPENVTKILE